MTNTEIITRLQTTGLTKSFLAERLGIGKMEASRLMKGLGAVANNGVYKIPNYKTNREPKL